MAFYRRARAFRAQSSLSPEQASERINESAGSLFNPFGAGISGGVYAGHLRLSSRKSPFEYKAKPILAGRVEQSLAGSLLRLRWRLPLWSYVFIPFWYGMIALFGFLVPGNWAPGVTSEDKTAFFLMLAAFLVLPLLMHAIGTRNSDEELDELLGFLSDVLGLKLAVSESSD